eukprot:scaffold149_cov315-Pinguiococcus_pyrenoidosus.AAC.45
MQRGQVAFPGKKRRRKGVHAAVEKYQAWLGEQLAATCQELLQLVAEGSLAMSAAAAESFLRLHAEQRVAEQSVRRTAFAQGVRKAHIARLLEALLRREDQPKLAGGKRAPAEVFVADFVNAYSDVRLAFWQVARTIAEQLRDAEASELVQQVASERLSANLAKGRLHVTRNLVRMLLQVEVRLDKESLQKLLVPPKRGKAKHAGRSRAGADAATTEDGDIAAEHEMDGADGADGADAGGKVMTLRRRRLLHRKALQDVWIPLLYLDCCRGALQLKVLAYLADEVIPHIRSPLPFVEPLLGLFSVGGGGEVSVLALNSIFVLMTKHGIDCPKYYHSLYQLLKPEGDGSGVAAPVLLHSPHRHDFLRLVERSISTRAAPAYLVAAFLKRLANAALSAAPHTALFSAAITYNCLHQHPGLTTLIHGEHGGQGGRQGENGGRHARKKRKTESGACNIHEPNPAASNAVGDQLWELAALEAHYLHSVGNLAGLLQKPFKKEDLRLNVSREYTKTTYHSLFMYEVASHEKGDLELQDGRLVGESLERVQGPKRKSGGRRSKAVVARRETPMSTQKPGALFRTGKGAASSGSTCVAESFAL